MTRRTLLRIDAIVNLLLGGLLIAFPRPLVTALGIPTATPAFYPSLLGAVLLGIGIALALEASNRTSRTKGLGLRGAVAINLSAGLVLAGWLLWGSLALPLWGQLLLWSLVALLIGLSTLELRVT